MRFIPGFIFRVGSSAQRSNTTTMLQARSMRNRGDDVFIFAHEIRIDHIQPKHSTVLYTFLDLTDNQKFSHQFNSIEEAEHKIARLAGLDSFSPIYETDGL